METRRTIIVVAAFSRTDPSIVTIGADDHRPAVWAAEVDGCGSRLIVGERTRERGSGPVTWQQTQRLFLRLTRQVVEHDVDRVQAITG